MPRTITVTALILRRRPDASFRLGFRAWTRGSRGRRSRCSRGGRSSWSRSRTATCCATERPLWLGLPATGPRPSTGAGRSRTAAEHPSTPGATARSRWSRTYRPGIAGGVLKVVGGSSYALRPPFLGEAMKLRRRASRRVVASVVRRGWDDVTLADGAATEPDLALVVVVMLQAVLVEALMPPSSGGGSGM